MTEAEVHSRLRKVWWIFAVSTFLIVFAVSVPILSYLGVFKPSGESGAAFFQSSSSVVIAICVLLDAFLAWGYRILTPPFPDKFFNKEKSAYLPCLKVLVILATILTVGATILSGFGEMFWHV